MDHLKEVEPALFKAMLEFVEREVFNQLVLYFVLASYLSVSVREYEAGVGPVWHITGLCEGGSADNCQACGESTSKLVFHSVQLIMFCLVDQALY